MGKSFHLKAGMLINCGLTTRRKAMASNVTQYVLMDTCLGFTLEMKGLCPLHARAVSLFEKFPSQHYVCGMDNLHTSSKLALYAIKCKSKVYIHGVTRQ